MDLELNRQRYLNSEIYSVLDEFEFISNDLIAVGGCVRDFLIGRDYDDIDIASSALPQNVIESAKNLGFRVYETGVEHGTVTIQSMKTGEMIEHTTFRKDVSTDGRRATIKFSKNFHTDSQRRDFTMNALGIGKDGTIHDYHNGVNDLKSNVLTFIGDTQSRLDEDALRALRAFRFACRFGLEIQPDDLYLICKTFENGFNDIVSTERVFMEIEKAMKQSDEEGWYRFITYLSFYVIPFVFGIEEDGYTIRRKISHPSVTESMEFDSFIHNLLWDMDITDELPLTVDQKRRMKFAKDLSSDELWFAVWKNKNLIKDTDVLQKDWFLQFLGFDFNETVEVLTETLEAEWPDELEGREIGEWQKTLFETKMNRLGR